MIHIHGKAPDGLTWRACVHRPTHQWYAILDDDCSVETIHGTMAARRGDVLMRGANDAFYVLTREAFDAAYDDE